MRMLDNDNALQSEALGIPGVNRSTVPSSITSSLNGSSRASPTGLVLDRIEVDLIHFSGPYFEVRWRTGS